MSFALVLKKTSWYRRRYSRPIRVNLTVALQNWLLSDFQNTSSLELKNYILKHSHHKIRL